MWMSSRPRKKDRTSTWRRNCRPNSGARMVK